MNGLQVEPMAVVGLVLGALVVPAALLAGRALSRTDAHVRTGAVACVIFMPLWFYAEQYSVVGLRLVPWDDFVYLQRVALYFAILLLLAMCLPRLSANMRRLTTVVMVIFAVYIVAESAAPATLGLYLGALDDSNVGDSQVIQSTGWSCGAAALAWAVRLMGKPASEREMARLAAIAPLRGMSVRGAVRALHRKGFRAEVARRARWPQAVAAPKPALAGWKLSATVGHAVVVVSADEQQVAVCDPMLGETTYTRDEFLERWDGELIMIQ